MAKTVKREVLIIVGGLLLISGIIVFALSRNKPSSEPYRPVFLSSWETFSREVFQFRNGASAKDVSRETLKAMHDRLVGAVRKLRSEGQLPREKEMVEQISPYLEQVLEYAGVAVQMLREKKEDEFDIALAKMGFTLEEIAKITSVFNDRFEN